MATKKPKKGSIQARWASEIPEQFKSKPATAETLKEIAELEKQLKKKQSQPPKK